MFDHAHYVRTGIAAAGRGLIPVNDAQKYGVNVVKTEADSPKKWAVILVHHLTGIENADKHNVYMDVLDEQGNRVPKAEVALTWVGQRPSEQVAPVVIDKPPYEPGGNYAMDKKQFLSFWVHDDTYPSDKVTGLSLEHNDEGEGNTWGHHSFLVVWMLVIQKIIPPVIEPPIQPPIAPVQPLNWRPGAEFAIDDQGMINLRVSQDKINAAHRLEPSINVRRWIDVIG